MSTKNLSPNHPAVLYAPGRKFRVVKEGARFAGMEPMPGYYQGWGRALEVGEEITCLGWKMGWGSDNIHQVFWDVPGYAFVSVLPDCGMWKPYPQEGYLEVIE